MSVLPRLPVLRRPRRVPGRRLLTLATAGALALGAFAVAPAATQAATPGTSAALYGAADPTWDGVYRQSLAILGLHAADVAPERSAVQWLLDQQCANGGFTSFRADTDAPCAPFDADAWTGGTDTNATALATQALLATGEQAAAGSAARFLQERQNADGGWNYTPESGDGSDPNSTALVMTALNAAGVAPTATTTPVEYLAGLQLGQGTPTTVEADRGAISPAWAEGVPNTLATVQVAPGLVGADLVEPPVPTEWSATATSYPTAPEPTAANVAGWASSWLAQRVATEAVSANYLPWAVLSFAATATAKDQAEDAYTTIRSRVLDFGTDPGALGQAAIAGRTLGRTDDLAVYARLIRATLTAPVHTPQPVVKDTTRPTVRVTVPKRAKRVSSWRKLRGTATDVGTGVARVEVLVVQKRGGTWRGWKGNKWVKRSTLAKARKAAKTFALTPKKSGAWNLKVTKLRQGRLKVTVRAVDRAGNQSKKRVTTAKLTRN